jgi:hypothetical protein
LIVLWLLAVAVAVQTLLMVAGDGKVVLAVLVDI